MYAMDDPFLEYGEIQNGMIYDSNNSHSPVSHSRHLLYYLHLLFHNVVLSRIRM